MSVNPSAALQAAVRGYFAGEQQELLLILAGCMLLAGLAVWLWLATRKGFSMAFMLTVLLAAGLLSATAISLLIRDADRATTLGAELRSTQQAQVLAMERERVAVVVSKYHYYRYVAGGLVALGLLGLLLSQRGWVHGVAAGLLLLAVAQIVIDHFSERRAVHYLEQLSAAAGTLNPATGRET
jgi:hypothetical protein